MSEEYQIEDEIEKFREEFDPLYKDVQNRIKDKVITKFLLTIQQQNKELSELRKENTLLKNQLTYILKRILLNKSDFNSTVKTTRINNLNNSLYYNKSMIVNNNNKQSASSMLRPLRSVEHYRVVSDNLNMDTKYKENNSSMNILGNENNGYLNTNTSVDNKVSSYLNSLYRHNFNNGNRNNYFLNKKSTLIEELFPNKNNSFYINTENDPSINIYGSNNKQKSVRKDLSSEKRETKNLYDKYTGNRSAERRNKNKLYNINNNSLKKRKKGNNLKYDKLSGRKNNYNTINNNDNKINKNNKPKKIQIYPKRSPFIANKF
jgi:hypothetical protein